MKLFLQTSMIFFGTLLAAGVVALGAPAESEVHMVGAAQGYDTVIASLLGSEQSDR